jgi:hypothetical protein
MGDSMRSEMARRTKAMIIWMLFPMMLSVLALLRSCGDGDGHMHHVYAYQVLGKEGR